MGKKTFFVSYTRKDRKWAEWIAWQLEDNGFSAILDVWDFAAGTSFVAQMSKAIKLADCTIAVLSQAYLEAEYTQAEWEAALISDPKGEKRILIPIKVDDFIPEPLLRRLIFIDLTGVNEAGAREGFLKGLEETRCKPDLKAVFPGTGDSQSVVCPPFPGALPRIWNVPHRRNTFFTGREDLLKKLRESLTSGDVTAITQRQAQAIHGLGGIGKTQLALEYVYRYYSEYRVVWWLQSEEPATLAADFAGLAVSLELVSKQVTDQQILSGAVKSWLRQNTGWLLIFDNATDPEGIEEFVPQVAGGHVIITSRHSDWTNLADRVPVDVFSEGQAVAFLLKRTRSEDREGAVKLAEELGCLPLALEQAAAYMAERKKSFVEYLSRFQTRRNELLNHGKIFTKYPDTVATTWQLSFDRAEEEAPGSGDLLKLFAFLAPDRIPFSMIAEGADEIPEPLCSIVKDETQLEDLVLALKRYSLTELDGDAVSVHRLVQAVTEDRLDDEEKRIWAGSAVSMVNAAFPYKIKEMETWPRTAPLLPHALAATSHAKKYGVSLEETGRLLNDAGLYMRHIAQFNQANDLLERALQIDELVYGPDQPTVARDLSNLGLVLQDLGDLAGALSHYERALRIDESVYGPNHPDVAGDLWNYGLLLRDIGEVDAACEALRRALEIWRKFLGEDHEHTVMAREALESLED